MDIGMRERLVLSRHMEYREEADMHSDRFAGGRAHQAPPAPLCGCRRTVIERLFRQHRVLLQVVRERPNRNQENAPAGGRGHAGFRVAAKRGGEAVFAVLLMAALCACQNTERSAPTSVRDGLTQGGRTGESRPMADPSTLPAGSPIAAAGPTAGATEADEPIAMVNGAAIDRRAFIRLLIESRGLSLLQQIVLREAARQEAQRQGFVVSPLDIDREYDLTLQAARFNGRDPEKLTPARREQLIEEWTQSRGVTRTELTIAMERQAWLRKMAEKNVETTDEMLQKEYARVHGERVEVRHLQAPAPRVCEQIRQRLAQGDRFEDLVADYSQNALSRDKRGLLPPFSENDPTVPADFAKAAFALEPGQVSNPIELEGSYHILKLERRIPADDLPFDEVKEALRKNLIARLTAERMEQLSESLWMRTRLRIDDQTLREQYTNQRAAGRINGPGLMN